MRPGMPSGRAHASVGRSCERLRRAAGALGRRGADALVARGKAVVEAAQEAVSAASGRQVIAVSCEPRGCSATKDCWSSGGATASPSPGPRSAAPCSPRPGNWSG